MKLNDLKKAIRDHDGAPRIFFNAGGIHQLKVGLIKGSLIEALDDSFPDGKHSETGLKLDENGFLARDTI